MAFVHALSGKVLINKSDLSADIKSWHATHKRDGSETTTINDSGAKGIPGLMEGELKIEGNFDSTALRLYATVNATVNVDNDLKMTVWPEGGTIGKPAIFGAFDTENFEVEASVDDAVSVTVEGTVDEMIDFGFSQHDLAAETVTGNAASVDGAAGTTNGGAALLHVSAASGTTPSITVKIQHSTNDSVWVDLITFTATAVSTYELKTLAQGTTVNRYIRATHTISGGGPSFTYAVSFARR